MQKSCPLTGVFDFSIVAVLVDLPYVSALVAFMPESTQLIEKNELNIR